jgi:acyl-coenzyme A thioesterase PaaI-like protein
VDGRHNPFALHSEFHRTEDEVRASITFTKPYEGPTGRVHGGAIAACYEDVIGYHLTLHRGVGYMAKLSIEFLRGTPLNEPVAFSSAVVSRGEGTMLVEGTSMANGKVTTRCVGEVVIVSGERFTPFRSDIARGEAPCRSEAPEAG